MERGPAEFERLRRHRELGIVGQEGDDTLEVALLDCVDEPIRRLRLRVAIVGGDATR